MPLLFVLFLLVPIVEIWAIIQVGQVLGVAPTIALLLLDSLLGAWLLRHQGRRSWRRFAGTLNAGRIPATETADGALILVGGTLLLTPGFVTDIAGFLLLAPPTRRLFRRYALKRMVKVGAATFGPAGVWTVRGATWGTRGARAYSSRRGAGRAYDVDGTAVETDRPGIEPRPGTAA
jgi:UPF0716 protein FxsA